MLVKNSFRTSWPKFIGFIKKMFNGWSDQKLRILYIFLAEIMTLEEYFFTGFSSEQSRNKRIFLVRIMSPKIGDKLGKISKVIWTKTNLEPSDPNCEQ